MAQSEVVLVGKGEQMQDPTEQFVLTFLRTSGALVKNREGNLQVRLPEEIAEFLGVPEETTFTFDSQEASPEAHLLTTGSSLVDGMIHLTRRRGRCAQLMFVGVDLQRRLRSVLAWESRDEAWYTDPLRLPLHDMTRIRVLERRIFHHEELLFHFKVTYICDEPSEELYAITVDPLLECVVPNVDWEQAVALNLESCRRRPVGDGPKGWHPNNGVIGQVAYTANRAYRVACNHLEKLVAPSLKHAEEDARKRLNEDLHRIDDYFRDAAEELLTPLRRTLRRLTTAQARTRLLPGSQPDSGKVKEEIANALRMEQTYRTELEELEAERQRRIEELYRRCEVRARAELISVARLLVPRIEWNLRIGRDGQRRDVTVHYDLLREHLGGLVCDGCEAKGELTWTEQAELLCDLCVTQTSSSTGQ